MSFQRAANPKFPRLLRVATCLALGSAASWLFYVACYAPLVSAGEADGQRCEQLQRLLQTSAAIRSEHRTQTERMQRLQEEIEAVQKRAPATANDGDFHAAVTNFASQEGVTVVDYRPGEARTLASHSEVEINVRCVGEYASLCRFVKRIETLDRLHEVRYAELQSKAGFSKYPLELRIVLYFGLASADAPTIAHSQETSAARKSRS